jgi:hypothetical protein
MIEESKNRIDLTRIMQSVHARLPGGCCEGGRRSASRWPAGVSPREAAENIFKEMR